MRTCLLCALSIASAQAAGADAPRLEHNPFSRPPSRIIAPRAEGSGGEIAPDQPVRLLATMVTGRAGFANVDGRVLRPGEEVDGYRLVRVFEDRAVFSRAGKPVVVFVKPQTVAGHD